MLSDKKAVTNAGPAKLTGPFTRPGLSDERIAHLATEALERENLVAGQRMIVSVERGWLTISGRASHTVERSAAECVLRCVPGVKGVTNRLVIALADR